MMILFIIAITMSVINLILSIIRLYIHTKEYKYYMNIYKGGDKND